MSVKIFKGVPYTGTLPATLTGTKAGYLHKYKIYGNTEQVSETPTPENPIVPSECGERTENLFDKNATDTSKGYINNNAITSSGSIAPNTNFYVSEYIRVSPNTNYSWKWTPSISSSTSISMSLYDDSQTLKRTISYGRKATVNLLTSSNETYVRVSVQKRNSDISMLNKGSTPLPYEPYGYKLPLTSGSTPVDIYIGDDTLSTDEYVDSGTGKVYRMVSGTLTPVDPPVPFPEIPTSANSTTISWAGQGLAPSEFDSIAEWVSATPKIYTNGAWTDAQTYTYDDGAWVADN